MKYEPFASSHLPHTLVFFLRETLVLALHGKQVSAVKRQQDDEEMKRCTFAPQTNKCVVRAHGPVLVRGLRRHIELKDVAQQREEDKRVREASAFGVRPGAVRRTVFGETLLEPFSLSERTSGWWEERRRKHEREREAECTFKPWTVEQERNRAMSRLLEWSSVVSSSSVVDS